MNSPILVQKVQWREQYVSAALNAKLSGVMKPGIYEGFALTPGTAPMTVNVTHGTSGRSVAVVDREGYSVTVVMTETGSVAIPAPGKWYICVEAWYVPNSAGYQRVVARETPEAHHLVVGTVTVSSAGQVIVDTDIDAMTERSQSGYLSRLDYATPTDAGVIKPDGATVEVDASGVLSVVSLPDWMICTVPIDFLIIDNLPKGFVPAHGTLLTDAPVRFPKAWAILQMPYMSHLLCSETDWQDASNKVYYTDAEGNEYSFDGIGGVCRFVLDLDNGTLRLPDLRGLHREAAGYNSLAVGQVARDEVRDITGSTGNAWARGGFATGVFDGAIYQIGTGNVGILTPGTGWASNAWGFDASRVAPTGPRTAPARYGVLPCVYLGA